MLGLTNYSHLFDNRANSNAVTGGTASVTISGVTVYLSAETCRMRSDAVVAQETGTRSSSSPIHLNRPFMKVKRAH